MRAHGVSGLSNKKSDELAVVAAATGGARAVAAAAAAAAATSTVSGQTSDNSGGGVPSAPHARTHSAAAFDSDPIHSLHSLIHLDYQP